MTAPQLYQTHRHKVIPRFDLPYILEYCVLRNTQYHIVKDMWNGLSNLRNLWFGTSYIAEYNSHIIKYHSKIMIYGKEEISKADIGIISNDSCKYSKTIYAQRDILELNKPTYH